MAQRVGERFMLERKDTALVVVDIQERLAVAMKKREMVVANTLHLIEAARLMELPVILTEQYPKGLGPTVQEVRGALPSTKAIEKITFSCCGQEDFLEAVRAAGRKNILLVGMETHVCVLQTCLGLLEAGYNVHLVRDAVCSRTKDNFYAGIDMAREAGAVITSTEIALFMLLNRAGTEEFKALSKRIK